MGNRKAFLILAGFSMVLFFAPVLLLSAEYFLRNMIPDKTHRWTCSGVVAVVFVNLVLVAYIGWCFLEGFPHPGGAILQGAASRKEIKRLAHVGTVALASAT